VLLHLEVRYAVAHQAADPVGLLEQHDVVTGPRELLRARHARGPRADDGDAPAGLRERRLRQDPALLPPLVDDEMLDRLDAHRVVVDVERASRLAWRGADASGELGEVVGRVQHVERFAPLLAVNEVVPVRDDVVDGTPGLAERNAAIHAARTLLRRRVVGKRQHELAEVPDALGRRKRDLLDPRELHETGDLPHRATYQQVRGALRRSRLRAALSIGLLPYAAARCFGAIIFSAGWRANISPSARLYSCGNTLTKRVRETAQSSSSASARVLPV
jgi:hypothetical protein